MENRKFLSKVNKTETCWLWTGAKCSSGYGNITIKYKSHAAHRVSYELFIGPILDNLHVLHKCDVRECVNPDHLFLGTNHDNVLDSVKKNRRSSRKGEQNGRSKLTKENVLDIKTLFASGRYTQKILAERYGVTRAMIGYIVRGNNWL